MQRYPAHAQALVCLTNDLAGRDAPSSYKLLATSVRNLRNVLEEVDEDYDTTRTLGPDDVKLLNQISRSHDILRQVDLALQSNNGHEDVNMNAVSDLKTGLDVAAHQLKLALDATTTGEIPLKLDTHDFPGAPYVSASVEDSSASRSRKSSMWSLGNKDGPRSPGASDATSVHTDKIDRPVEEKQLLSPSASNPSEARASMSFGSPFADPLSMGIEAATSFILGGDDDLAMSAYARPRSRSRAESSVSAATETFVSAPGSPEIERKPASLSIDSSVAVENRDATEETLAAPAGNEDPEPRPATVGETLEGQSVSTSTTAEEQPVPPVDTTASEFSHAEPEDTSQEGAPANIGATTPSMTEQNQTLDDASSKSATTRPSSSRESVIQDKPLPDIPSSSDVVFEPEQTPRNETLSSQPVRAVPEAQSVDQAEAEEEDFAQDLNRTMDAVLAGHQQAAAFKPVPQSTNSNAAPPRAQAQAGEDPVQPPPPERRPPPPPPPPIARRSRPNVKLSSAKSKYRIVNDASEDELSDEELYSASRPTSPAQVASPTSLQSPPLVTPTIQIDQSALDEEHKGEQSSISQRDENGPDLSSKAEPDDAPHLPRSTSQPPNSMTTPARVDRSETSAKPNQPQATVRVEPRRTESSPKSQTPTSPHSSEAATPPQPRQSPPPPPQSPPLQPSVRKRIEAAVRAGDRLLAKEIEMEFKQEVKKSGPEAQKPKKESQKPPPVPPRPKSRYNRPRAATSTSSPADRPEKEIATEAGLEVTDRALASRSSNSCLASRVSVDHALQSGATRDPAAAPEPAASLDVTRHNRAASTSQLPPPQFSLHTSQAPSAFGANGGHLGGWYGPGTDQTSQSELDSERIEHICHFWNSMDWFQTDKYLMGYLDSLDERGNMAVARRVRHLLGVCATFRGEFAEAMNWFTSILEIQQPSDLSKPGNCEACYWLGDLYAMQNQRLEALIAYCAAQWGDVFRDPEEPKLYDLIKAEQEAVQFGMPRSEFKIRWSQEAKEGCGSILDPQILPAAVVKYLLDVEPRRDPRSSGVNRPHELDTNKPRSSAFFSLSSSPHIGKFRRNRVSPDHFHPYAPWPLQYDPTFVMENVKRERILGQECDLLEFVQSNNGEAKIPKTGPMSISRMDCFTCSDLSFLITAVRECLKMLEMEWSEVANDHGAWFIVRYRLMDGTSKKKMATVHYFAMSLFRQSFRSSYGVEVCSHGVSSARIMDPANLDYEKGVHQTEPKRIKKLITETLEEAEKNRPKARKRHSSIGLGIGRSSSDDQPVKVLLEGSKSPGSPRSGKPASSGT